MYDAFPVNLTEVYISPGEHQVEDMDQLETSPLLKDEQYLIAIRTGGLAGDRAIIWLYSYYHKEVKSTISDMIRLHPGCKTEADDMVHDAFLVMLHKIQFESIHATSLKSFWIGIARRLTLNQVKKNGRISLVEDPEEFYGTVDATPESIYLTKEKNQLFENYLNHIGHRCKELLLFWMAQYTMDEIASRLNLSGAPMARKVKHMCFKKLKKLVQSGNKFHPDDISW